MNSARVPTDYHTDEALKKWDERYSRKLERLTRRSVYFGAEPMTVEQVAQ